MRNRLFSILIALFITLPFMSCSLPPGSHDPQQAPQQQHLNDPLDDPQQAPQQQHLPDDTKVRLRNAEIYDLKYSPDGTRFVVAGNFGILLYDTQTYNKPDLLPTGHKGHAWSVAFSPDGTMLASASPYNTIRLLDVNTGQLIRTLTGLQESTIHTVTFGPDGRTIIVGNHSDKILRLFDVDTGELLRTLSGHTDMALSVTISPDRRTIAAGSDDGAIRLWNVNTGQLLQILKGHTRLVRTVAFSPDGKTLASGASDLTIRLWDVNTGQQIRTFKAPYNSVAFSPDGRMIASGSWTSTILWDANTGQQIHILLPRHYGPGGGNGRCMVTFSPDGKTIAARDTFGLHLYDVETGKRLRTLLISRDRN